MKVKDYKNKHNIKIIHPESGKIGYFKGEFTGGIFLGAHLDDNKAQYAIPCNEDEYLEWDVYSGNDRCDIHTLFNKNETTGD